MSSPPSPRYRILDFDQLPGVPCPCGIARRGLADVPEFPCTIHRTEITATAKLHYHHRLTEVYYVLRLRVRTPNSSSTTSGCRSGPARACSYRRAFAIARSDA